MRLRKVALLASALGVAVLLFVVVSVGAGPAKQESVQAVPPAYPISYQGRLADALGAPVANQTVNLTFRLYQQPTGGSPIWSQVRSATTDPLGTFTVILDVIPGLGITDLSSVYMGIEVGSDGEMIPRQRVGGAPYAFTLVPGNGITGSIPLGLVAVVNVVNGGSGTALAAQATGQGAGVVGTSATGYGGYFDSLSGYGLGVAGTVLVETNLRQVVMHRWYAVNEAGLTYAVPAAPKGVLFDGGSIWVTSSGANSVQRRRTSDGAVMGTYAVGSFPVGMAYDGGRLWVANRGDNTVSRIVASNPVMSSTIAVGSQPNGACFDGMAVWVVNEGSNNVTKIRASTGAVLGTYPVGISPKMCACDRYGNVWVTNEGSDNVSRIRAADGFALPSVSVGDKPVAIVFDGAHMWVANSGEDSVTKIRASDAASVRGFWVGDEPRGLAFDGYHIWVTNHTSNNVYKIDIIHEVVLGPYDTGTGPRGIAFDGSDMWVVNGEADSISKL